MRNRIMLAALGLVLLGMATVLSGCGALRAATPVAEAATGGFYETAKAGGLNISLAVTPLKIGTNTLLVSLDRRDVSAVETQVVMGSMGHGEVVDLAESSPGKYAATSDVINMDGKWLIRVKATLASGEEKDALFHLSVKP